MKLRFTAALIGVLAVSGCVAAYGPVTERKPLALTVAQVEQIKTAVGRDLRDPMSAQYQRIQARRIGYQNGVERVVVCGAVNAKNAYGGYVGFMAFGGELGSDGQFTLIGIDTRALGYYDSNCRVNYGMTVL